MIFKKNNINIFFFVVVFFYVLRYGNLIGWQYYIYTSFHTKWVHTPASLSLLTFVNCISRWRTILKLVLYGNLGGWIRLTHDIFYLMSLIFSILNNLLFRSLIQTNGIQMSVCLRVNFTGLSWPTPAGDIRLLCTNVTLPDTLVILNNGSN